MQCTQLQHYSPPTTPISVRISGTNIHSNLPNKLLETRSASTIFFTQVMYSESAHILSHQLNQCNICFLPIFLHTFPEIKYIKSFLIQYTPHFHLQQHHSFSKSSTNTDSSTYSEPFCRKKFDLTCHPTFSVLHSFSFPFCKQSILQRERYTHCYS